MDPDLLREILMYYLEKIDQLQYVDVDSLSVAMQMLADDMYDEFGVETEEIEYAANNSNVYV
eukprot:CAMPEP_0168315470 /NCGR_PEP_ID=MMETSP0210-20121227/11347_1 /TAXON_ID=40633 /ORGANISM="Condylostoma magnum, Strain COL2" /LENGTH=61 /DNA_ID=CAMNT_0008288807 /DNA_START=437 /DNA_END=622 /DNA_ORIENTATION=+